MLQNLTDAGVLWSMDEWLESNGDNLKAYLGDALKYSKEVVGGGKTYFLPVQIQEKNEDVPNLNGFVGFFTRWDYYKELGCPELHSEDDYLNMLKQMVDAHPETADGKKVYAFGAWIDWGLWPYTICYPFSHGYNNLAGNQLYNQVDDEIEDMFTDTDGIFWQGLAFFNKAYRMGIMDPEAFTMKYDQYEAKIRNGELLVGGCNWISPDLPVCGEDAAMVLLPGVFPYASQIYPIEQSFGYMKGNALVISANCKYPEKAMELLDFLNSDEGARLISTGIQGEDWDYVDGVPQMIGTRLENFISNDTVEPGYASKTGGQGIDLYSFLKSRCDTNSAADGYPLNLTKSKEYNLSSVTAGMQDFCDYYTDGKAQYPGEAYVWMVDQGMMDTVDAVPRAGTLMESLSDEATRIASKADEYFQANIAKIITCEDDAAFQAQKQKMIDDVMAMGYQTVLDEVAEKFERAKNLADSF